MPPMMPIIKLRLLLASESLLGGGVYVERMEEEVREAPRALPLVTVAKVVERERVALIMMEDEEDKTEEPMLVGRGILGLP